MGWGDSSLSLSLSCSDIHIPIPPYTLYSPFHISSLTLLLHTLTSATVSALANLLIGERDKHSHIHEEIHHCHNHHTNNHGTGEIPTIKV